MTIDPEVAALLEEGIPKLHRPSPEAPNWGTTPMQSSGGTMTKPSDTFQPEALGPCRWCARPLFQRGGRAAGHNAKVECPADVVEMPYWYVEYYGDIHWPEAKHLVKPVPRGQVLPTPSAFCQATLRAQIGRDHKCECAHAHDHFGYHECKRPECRRLWR